MKRNKLFGVFCAVIASSCLVSGCAILPEEEVFETAALVTEYDKQEFSMINVQRGDVSDYNRVTCKYVEANVQEIELNRWVRIKEIYVKEGQKVKKDDPLISYADEELENQINDYKYQIEILEAKIKHAEADKKLEIEKQKLVHDDKTALEAIEKRYEAVVSGYSSELELLQMRLEDAEWQMTAFQVRAEIDGTVTGLKSMNVNMSNQDWHDMWDNPVYGQEQENSNILFKVIDEAKPKFVATLNSEINYNNIKDGEKIEVICADKSFETTIQVVDDEMIYLVPDEFPEDVPNGEMGYARDVKAERKDVLWLPKSAITKMGEDTIVYKEDENGFKTPVKVEIGLVANNRAEIISGLEEGDAVIVR